MSEVKVNKISPRTNCGTVTLGDSGDTFTIPAGVSITNSGTASGFGATGAVSWNTTVKTSGFTATAGEGYFVNTTGGAVSVNLPAGSAGAVVGFKDYAGTFDTNAVTLVQNGSDKIGGSTVNATLDTEGIAVTLVFIDSTQGWLVTDSGLQTEAPTSEYVTATGGTITTCGDFKIHTFTGPGTFCVSNGGNVAGNNQLEYIVVAGGGGNGFPGGNTVGGAGAGGFRFASPSLAPATYPGKPLAAPAGLTAAAGAVPVTVGAGGSSGTGACGQGTTGSTSTFSTISSAGGAKGSVAPVSSGVGDAGGSGAGAAGGGYNRVAGAGNTPPVSPPQGQPGGNSGNNPSYPDHASGGGGGAICAGAGGRTVSNNASGNGGDGAGIPTAFGANGESCGSFRYYAGGGGGGSYAPVTPENSTGGKGGGGNGGTSTPATANTGGGGGGGGTPGDAGGTGGSGVVIIRYKFQN